MGRFKCRVRPDRGLPNKRDTPVKTALSKGGKCRRFLPKKHYEALPEEPEERETLHTVTTSNHVLTSIKPIHSKLLLHLSNSAFTENPRGETVSPAASAGKKHGHKVPPTGHSTIQVIPDEVAFKCAGMQIKKDEQNLAVTPESITSSSMELDTTFSSDDDEDDENEDEDEDDEDEDDEDEDEDDEEEEDEEEKDCHSSTASSSLSSPEIFRKENYVETVTLPKTEELLDLHLRTKNSTLLEVSHAESIDVHISPDLSTIIDASTILADKHCDIKRPEAETKLHMDSLKSEEIFKWKTPRKPHPPKLINRRPILFKKRVCFKSPIIAEVFDAKHIPATKITIHNASESIQTSGLTEQMKSDVDISRAGENSSEQEALQLQVRLRRPFKSEPEKAKFFDFIDDSDRDVFFQRMRERCVKLKSAPLFPLTAAKNKEFMSCHI